MAYDHYEGSATFQVEKNFKMTPFMNSLKEKFMKSSKVIEEMGLEDLDEEDLEEEMNDATRNFNKYILDFNYETGNVKIEYSSVDPDGCDCPLIFEFLTREFSSVMTSDYMKIADSSNLNGMELYFLDKQGNRHKANATPAMTV